MTARKESLSPTPEESKVFTPQFSLTKEVISHLETSGINKIDYQRFVSNLEEFLLKIAEIESLEAIGIIAVPSSEGGANFLIDTSGYVLDAAFYWSDKSKLNSSIDFEISEQWFGLEEDNSMIQSFWFTSFSTDHFLKLDDFAKELNNPNSRAVRFTATANNCEFWGMTTTELLRMEQAAVIL